MFLVLHGLAHKVLLVCVVQAAWQETSHYSCLRNCVCPSGGGPCTPSSNCSTNQFACKHGFKRFSDNSARCYPVGCQKGALQVLLHCLLLNVLGLMSAHLCCLHHCCMRACSPQLALPKCCMGSAASDTLPIWPLRMSTACLQ